MLDFKNINLKFFNKNKIECGIFSNLNFNNSSSLYIIFIIIFLIFDVEIIFILLIINKIIKVISMIFFLFILISLIVEFYETSLKWND